MSQTIHSTAATSGNAARDVLQITRAFDFAARAHVHQRRKGRKKEPYLNHLAGVARLVAQATAGEDTNLVIAALLHDAIEDAKVTRDEIAAAFGEDVAALVAEVTDDKSLLKAERKRLQVETAPTKSPRARMIKMADKTDNLHALAASPPADWLDERKREYVAWSAKVVAGCAGVNFWLEEQFEGARQIALRSLTQGVTAEAHLRPVSTDGLLSNDDEAAIDLSRAVPTDKKPTSEFAVSVADIPDAIRRLAQEGEDASWIVFLFRTPIASDLTSDKTLNLQYSIQDGVVGLDWVLIGSRNMADEAMLAEFISSKGHAVTQMEFDHVQYLRVEDGDLAKLGQSICTGFYQLAVDADMGLLVSGFEYEPVGAAPGNLDAGRAAEVSQADTPELNRVAIAQILPSFLPIILERGVPGYESTPITVPSEKRLSTMELRSVLVASTVLGVIEHAGSHDLDAGRVRQTLTQSVGALDELSPAEKTLSLQLVDRFFANKIVRADQPFDDWVCEALWEQFQEIPYEYPSALSAAISFGLMINHTLRAFELVG